MWEIQQHICILKKYLLVRPKCLNSVRIIVGFVFGVVLVDFPRLCHDVIFGLNLSNLVTSVGFLSIWREYLYR